jgi:hypothetical protein
MSRRSSIGRYPEKPWDWDKVALKYQRSVDAEEAKARASIQRENAARKREQQQLKLKFSRKGTQP